jgi:hypothetical protein
MRRECFCAEESWARAAGQPRAAVPTYYLDAGGRTIFCAISDSQWDKLDLAESKQPERCV